MLKNSKRLFFAIFIISCILWIDEIASFDFFEPLDPPRPTQVIVNKGLRIASPENTLPAFDLCIKNGFEWIKADVRMTRDGQHIIIQNRRFDWTTNGMGMVSAYTLEDAKKLDAGSWFALRFAGTQIPTLKETLEFCKGKINLKLNCIDIDPKLLVQEVQLAGMENQVLVHGNLLILKLIKLESKGTIATQAIYYPYPWFPKWSEQDRPDSLEIEYKDVTHELITHLRESSITTQVKCFDESDNPKAWRELTDMGVDLIETDQPEGVVAEYTWKVVGNNRPVWITAHRGVNRLAPENTIPAFQKAIDMGLDFIEIDVRTTKDGKQILSHDGSLKRIAQYDGNVKDINFDIVRILSAGKWFGRPYRNEKTPTLDEVFELGKSKIKFYVDTKDITPEALVDAMRCHNVLDDCVIYINGEKALAVKALESKAKIMPSLGDPEKVDELIKLYQPYAFDTKWEILSRNLIDKCHANGVKVFSDAMGYENIDSFRQVMEWDIDCIQTDEPIILLRAMELQAKWFSR